MQQFVDQNKELIALVIGALINALLSAVVRYLPTNHWAIQILRIILQSGNSFGNQANAIAKKAGDTAKIVGVSVLFGLLMLGCSPKFSFVSARDSDGDAYQFCFKVVGTVPLASGRTLGCADVESQVAQLEAAYKAQHPQAKTVRVRQLKVAEQ